jgi:hemoglobin
MIRFSRHAAALVAACGFACATAYAESPAKTLYERLGGQPALNAVVAELWNVVAADARINGYFTKTRPEAFAGQLADFLCQASGGPCQYKGKDMASAHTGMHLSEADFSALAEDTGIVLDKFKVPAREKGEVLGMLGGLKGDVVGR